MKKLASTLAQALILFALLSHSAASANCFDPIHPDLQQYNRSMYGVSAFGATALLCWGGFGGFAYSTWALQQSLEAGAWATGACGLANCLGFLFTNNSSRQRHTEAMESYHQNLSHQRKLKADGQNFPNQCRATHPIVELYRDVGVSIDLNLMQTYLAFLIHGIEKKGLCPNGRFLNPGQTKEWLRSQTPIGNSIDNYLTLIKGTRDERSYLEAIAYASLTESATLRLHQFEKAFFENSHLVERERNEAFQNFVSDLSQITIEDLAQEVERLRARMNQIGR